ncbi:hypothetical protein H5410_059242 [Solanum commersonii]|uniref:Uncharacterized protein n=1 Tax=Solanum commersonii TaxID=4109 RepID=A0A9J5W2D3_SOLCO|nr:hypothetical protein H5410_059242 [Solanum commersonii]
MSHLINTLLKVSNARIARFVSEAAPPQFVNIMRNRASKMLETIKEDDKEANETSSISPKSLSSSMKSNIYYIIHTSEFVFKQRYSLCSSSENGVASDN